MAWPKMPLPFLPRALVVEDDEDLRDFAATILEETDLALAASTSFEDARRYLDEHASELALVFLAIGEPHLRNGVNLAYDIEDDWPWIKLLVSSGEPGFRRSYLPRTASYLSRGQPQAVPSGSRRERGQVVAMHHQEVEGEQDRVRAPMPADKGVEVGQPFLAMGARPRRRG
jgi:CheY-like chemotaxis protein